MKQREALHQQRQPLRRARSPCGSNNLFAILIRAHAVVVATTEFRAPLVATQHAKSPRPAKEPSHPSAAPTQTPCEKRLSQNKVRDAGRGKTGKVAGAPQVTCAAAQTPPHHVPQYATEGAVHVRSNRAGASPDAVKYVSTARRQRSCLCRPSRASVPRRVQPMTQSAPTSRTVFEPRHESR